MATLRPDDSLVALLGPWIERGQSVLSDELRSLVAERAPRIAALLDGEPDEAFLEPLACAYASRASGKGADYARIYAGSLSPDKRPPRLDAVADAAGRLFLPRLGFLVGLPASAAVTLERDDASPLGYAVAGAKAAPRMLPLEACRLAGGPITLLPYPLSGLLERELAGLEPAAEAHRRSLEAALEQLTDVWPALAALLSRVVRSLVLFDDPALNSFAAPAAHGIAFLDVAHGHSTPYFVEDVSHQGGHVLFTAAWAGAPPLLDVPPELLVAELTEQDDHRTMLVALHGMVTQSLMVGALDRILASSPGLADLEVEGRLLFALRRLGLDLRLLAARPVYTDAGTALIRDLIAVYSSAAERHREALVSADFTGQPYNFDAGLYEARNRGRPLPARA